jgi:hypothetical protein
VSPSCACNEEPQPDQDEGGLVAAVAVAEVEPPSGDVIVIVDD